MSCSRCVSLSPTCSHSMELIKIVRLLPPCALGRGRRSVRCVIVATTQDDSRRYVCALQQHEVTGTVQCSAEQYGAVDSSLLPYPALPMHSHQPLPSPNPLDQSPPAAPHSHPLLHPSVPPLHSTQDKLLVAVGLLDCTVKIFFDDTLKFFLSLYGHKLPVMCLDISYDGNILISGSADKTIKIWGLDFGDCHR
jgi:WD domain, G-beta repeat